MSARPASSWRTRWSSARPGRNRRRTSRWRSTSWSPTPRCWPGAPSRRSCWTARAPPTARCPRQWPATWWRAPSTATRPGSGRSTRPPTATWWGRRADDGSSPTASPTSSGSGTRAPAARPGATRPPGTSTTSGPSRRAVPPSCRTGKGCAPRATRPRRHRAGERRPGPTRRPAGMPWSPRRRPATGTGRWRRGPRGPQGGRPRAPRRSRSRDRSVPVYRRSALRASVLPSHCTAWTISTMITTTTAVTAQSYCR